MNRSRSRPVGRNGKSAGHSAKKAVAQVKKPLWRRAPAVWLGGFATIILGGALANLLSNQAQQQISPSPSESQAASPSITARPLPSSHSLITVNPTTTREAGPPLTVVSEDPINPQDNGGIWAFPDKFILTSSQLMVLNGLKDIYDQDIRLGFNLDSADTEAEYAAGWGTDSWKPDYFSNYTVSINPGAQQIFNLRTVTLRHSCSFEYRLTVLDGTRKVSQIISDGGQFFRVTAIRKEPAGPGMRFPAYQAVYAGGVENENGNGAYVRVNPETFLG